MAIWLTALTENWVTSLSGFVLGLLTLVLWFSRKKQQYGDKLPPGNLGWPLLGESFQFLRGGGSGGPRDFVTARMHKYDTQIFKTSLIGSPTAVFCGPTAHRFLFSNENKVLVTSWPAPVAKLFGSSILTTAGDEAKRLRKCLMTFLKPEALTKFVGTMDSVARHHLQTEWCSRDEVKVLPLVKQYTFSLSCHLFASIDDPATLSALSKEFRVLVKGIMQFPLNIPGTRYYRANKSGDAIRRVLQLIIDRRRVALAEKTTSPDQDLLSYLLSKPDENGQYLSDVEIVDNILVMIFAGHDTSSCTITMLIKYLAELPHCYDGILREQREIAESKGEGELLHWEDLQKMKYSWNVVSEVLRLNPPVEGTFRKATSDFTFAGFNIPKGWQLYWNSTSMHHNPEYFPEPKKFDPERFEGDGPIPYTYLPFGGGPRMCPGKEFARFEILVFLHNLVNMFSWKLVLPEEKIRADPMPTPTQGLPIRLQPHHPS